jgi:hypothetical protein
MPKPNKGESRKDFIQRCMSSQEANKDFPDRRQRYAFCISQFNRTNNPKPKRK